MAPPVPPNRSSFQIQSTSSEHNGLREPNRLMVDKITTVDKKWMGWKIGCVEGKDLVCMNRAIQSFLGFGGASRG